MKKKLLLIAPLLLLLLGLLGPAVYKDRALKNQVPQPPASSVTTTPVPAPASPEENRKADQPPIKTGEAKSPGNDRAPETGPAPPPADSKSSLPPPAESTGSEAVTVKIAVVGENRELLYGPGIVKLSKNNPGGLTALGALDATGLPYNISKRFPGFVEAIAGLHNKGQGGWLYQVNGEVPPVAADKRAVAANDRVIWWYSSSINAPPPRWEQLASPGR